jgi:hypothetical protein
MGLCAVFFNPCFSMRNPITSIVRYSLLPALLSLCACSSQPRHEHYLPANPGMVVALKTGPLNTAMRWSRLLGQDPLAQLPASDSVLRRSLEDLPESGVDLSSTLYAYTADSQGLCVLLPLDDASAWVGFLKKHFPEAAIQQRNGHAEAWQAGSFYAGWTDDVLVLMPNPGLRMPAARMQQALTPAAERSLAADPRFQRLMRTTRQAVVWIPGSRLLHHQQRIAAELGFPLSPQMMQQTALGAALSFEEGLIEADVKWFAPERLQPLLRQLGQSAVGATAVEPVAGHDLSMLFAARFTHSGLEQFMRQSGLQFYADLMLASRRLSTGHILKALDGSVVVARHYDTGSAGSRQLVALRIRDRQAFQSLMDVLVQTDLAQPMGREGRLYHLSGGASFLARDGRYAVWAPSPAEALAFLQRRHEAEPKPRPFGSQVSGRPFALYLDLRSRGQGNALLSHLSAQGMGYGGGVLSSRMRLYFTNTEQNSLLQLLDRNMDLSRITALLPADDTTSNERP